MYKKHNKLFRFMKNNTKTITMFYDMMSDELLCLDKENINIYSYIIYTIYERIKVLYI